ncbi:MAG TPA: GNAT family N-acetyltransferase [Rhodoferax sp.]
MLEEQRFDVRIHDRVSFQSGEPLLDEYLRKYAAQQIAKGITSAFVLVESNAPGRILGFYTLSAAQIDAEDLSEADRKRLPRYPIPCFRMGRLARDLGSRGQGVGEILMGLAIERCRAAKQSIAAYALLVDAKNAKAKLFYEKFGFTACSDSSMSLYMPI